ncbi:MAG: valine--tRNA ligase [Flavobacteriales bacterium]|nr:valine--tRNA ligase [Flavobacteriales bacterium]
MKIPKTYNPSSAEEKWYNHWIKMNYFHSKPDNREAYSIVIPPPNVTGVLHMGHMLNNTIQDILIRRARMQGYNTCWVPGTDHASIATEAKVVKKLADEGIYKQNITRQEFLKHAWKWKEKHGGVILEQLKRIGASCDWERTKFTMDDNMNDSVINVFIDLYNKGLIYRGVRMVNWDPSAKTALSDEEVIYKEIDSKLYYISYKIENSSKSIIIATTRPETILGDTAICVNPKDKRYKHLKNQNAIIPLINRKIPIIFDEYVDIDFGTGALKITPAHDINDYKIGDKHNLDKIDILNDNGTLSKEAKLYVGEDRFDVRKKIALDLKNEGCLIKTEKYKNKVGFSERTNTVIEPKLSMQWFVKMENLAIPALKNVINNKIKFHPPKFKNTYKYWMENIKDWCISRQLWWGQRIPVYYYEGNKYVVAKNKQEALKIIKKFKTNFKLDDLRQEEDVLDTWFSSWLWPISVFDGINNPDNEDISYYYPTNDLITAPEILFFWVARMIMAGYEYKKELPFKNVYLTGIVRDNIGRKMSKSLGNSPDPIDLINKYGADGVRVGMLLCSPAGNDLPFNENLCEQGRNFSNKIWNAFRLIKGWEVAEIEQEESSKQAVIWLNNKISKDIFEINQSYKRYRISEALMIIYKLVWDEFCSWYLEIIKPEYGKPIDKNTYEETIYELERLLKLLHPFMPFISEELWHLIDDRKDDIIVSKWPNEKNTNEKIINDFDIIKQVISEIRNIRSQYNISIKEKISISIIKHKKINLNLDSIICKLANLSAIDYISIKPENTVSFLINSNEYFVALKENINIDLQLKKLSKELDYTKGFLKIVMKKLSNENFINKAPVKLVENEKKKKEDAENKILLLERKISSLL